MNEAQMDMWKSGVSDFHRKVDEIIDDRKKLKELIKEHLSQFFEFDDFECDSVFEVIQITLPNVDLVLPKNIGDIGMDWTISTGYDKKANPTIIINFYPFGRDE